MSYQATDYVYHLNLGRRLGTPGKKYPILKQLLNALAHKCDSRTGVCLPLSSGDIATSQDIGESTARRSLKILEDAGVIRYLIKGNGRGIKSVIELVDFQAKVLGAAEKVSRESKKVLTVSEKVVVASGTIRKEEKQVSEVNTSHHSHSSAGLNLTVEKWIAVKEQLKATLPSDQWNLWVRPMLVLKVMDEGRFLLFSVPPNDQIVRAARANKPLLLRALREYGCESCSFTKYPDEYTLERLCKEFPDFYDQLPDALKRRKPDHAPSALCVYGKQTVRTSPLPRYCE